MLYNTKASHLQTFCKLYRHIHRHRLILLAVDEVKCGERRPMVYKLSGRLRLPPMDNAVIEQFGYMHVLEMQAAIQHSAQRCTNIAGFAKQLR